MYDNIFKLIVSMKQYSYIKIQSSNSKSSEKKISILIFPALKQLLEVKIVEIKTNAYKKMLF